MMVAEHGEQIDPLRHTGRTTRMLEKAQTEGFYASVYSGLRVLIVCATYAECTRMADIFSSMASARGFVVSCPARTIVALAAPDSTGEILEVYYRFMPTQGTFSYLYQGNDYAAVYVDHYAHEYATRKSAT